LYEFVQKWFARTTVGNKRNDFNKLAELQRRKYSISKKGKRQLSISK
jgi:hypothetical protein